MNLNIIIFILTTISTVLAVSYKLGMMLGSILQQLKDITHRLDDIENKYNNHV
jgi:hypothetical protein